MRINFGPYGKFVTGIVGQALTYATLYYGGNHYVAAAVAVASALGVYAVPERRPKRPGPAASRATHGDVTATAGLFGWFPQVTQQLAQIQAQLTAQGAQLNRIEQKEGAILAASDDVTAAAAAMVSAANAISTVATDLQAAEANIKTEIAPSRRRSPRCGTPVNTADAERRRRRARPRRSPRSRPPTGGGRAGDPAARARPGTGRELTPGR